MTRFSNTYDKQTRFHKSDSEMVEMESVLEMGSKHAGDKVLCSKRPASANPVHIWIVGLFLSPAFLDKAFGKRDRRARGPILDRA